MSERRQIAAAAWLAWHRDMGVAHAFADAPIDRRAQSEAPPPRLKEGSRPPLAGSPPAVRNRPVAADEAVEAAKATADAASDLDSLRAALETFEGCALRFSARNLVFADGEADADLMVIGEAPGYEEDAQGKPFVGRSGQLLDRMLAAIGRTRARDVYIANVLPWRPPGNRTPTAQEIAICQPFIARQIALVRPKAVLLAGGVAAQTMLATKEGIRRLRGRWGTVAVADGADVPALPTYHPAYLLRRPIEKRDSWRDLLAMKARLDSF